VIGTVGGNALAARYGRYYWKAKGCFYLHSLNPPTSQQDVHDVLHNTACGE
jgi:hypothetical protein